MECIQTYEECIQLCLREYYLLRYLNAKKEVAEEIREKCFNECKEFNMFSE